jgi:hypothetical protein
VRIGKNLWQVSYSEWPEKQDALSPLPFNFALEYATRRIQENQEGLKLNGTLQLVAYAADFTTVWKNMDTTKESTDCLLDASMEADLDVNAEKTKYMLKSRY